MLMEELRKYKINLTALYVHSAHVRRQLFSGMDDAQY